MSAVAWTHWDIAFEEAGKCAPDQRLAFALPTAQFSKALSALANDHGWLAKSDPRYQEACRTGRLEWWDERGRCVVVEREKAPAPTSVVVPAGVGLLGVPAPGKGKKR